MSDRLTMEREREEAKGALEELRRHWDAAQRDLREAQAETLRALDEALVLLQGSELRELLAREVVERGLRS